LLTIVFLLAVQRSYRPDAAESVTETACTTIQLSADGRMVYRIRAEAGDRDIQTTLSSSRPDVSRAGHRADRGLLIYW
jgi:hypothetical protein